MKFRIKIFILILAVSGMSQICPGQADSLLKLLGETETNIKKINLLNELADLYMYRNLDSALSFAQEAISVSRNAGHQLGEINALIRKCDILREQGEYDKSMLYTERIKEYAFSSSDEIILAKYHLLKGEIFVYQGKYNQALEQLKQSFEIFRNKSNLIGMGDAQRNIALCLLARGEYDIMKEYEMSALDCYEQADYKKGIAAMMNNLGFNFNTIETDYNQAEKYFRKAIKLNIETGNNYWLSKNYINLSLLKEKVGQIDSAFYYCNAAFNLSNLLSNPLWKSTVLNYLGRINYNYKDSHVALDYLKEALKIAYNINSPVHISSISNLIQKIYLENGQTDSAYHYLAKYYIYKDSILRNNNDIEYAELKYQLENELNKQKTEAQYQRMMFYFVIIAIFLIMIIIIFYMHNKKQKIKIRNTLLEKENLEKDIELKNKELTNNILVTKKKNEVIGNIIGELKQILGKLPEPSRKILKQIIQNLSNTKDEKGWEDFEMAFNNVYESFFEKLNLHYPNLSVKDKRLCALLRLNLSSKQIAEVTNLTPPSVDLARSRLRKKLGIEKHKMDLSQFLTDF